MALTPDAKKLLAETIRGSQQDPEKGLRGRLLRAIHDEADRRYRLSVPIAEAGLDETHRRRRERIEAWLDERARAAKPKNAADLKATKTRLLAQAEKEASATLINRLVLVRHLEAPGLSKPAVLSGGWNSKGYRELREFAPALCTSDDTEGYAMDLDDGRPSRIILPSRSAPDLSMGCVVTTRSRKPSSRSTPRYQAYWMSGGVGCGPQRSHAR